MQTEAATAAETRLHAGVGGMVGQRAAATLASTVAIEDPSRLPDVREGEGRTAAIADAQQNVNVRPSQIGTGGQLLAGGIAGAVSKTCTAPLARLTILFQVQGMNANGERLSRPSILKEAARIVREEGFRAFWKGNGVTIVHRLPYSSVNFFAYEQYKMRLRSRLGIEGKQESLGVGMGTRLVAGGAAGITAATLTYPLDLVRTRLAAQSYVPILQLTSDKYLTVTEFLVNIMRRFRFQVASVPGLTLLGQDVLPHQLGFIWMQGRCNWFACLGQELLAAPCALRTMTRSLWLIHVFQVIDVSQSTNETTEYYKDTRRITDVMPARGVEYVAVLGISLSVTKQMYYTGISHAFKTIYSEEGPRGLYKGLGTTLLGVGPNIAINFCVYETLKSLWIQRRQDSSPVLVSLGCGSLAGICSSTATFPLDLVRRRMQLEGAGGKARVYKDGLVSTVGHIVRVEGWFGLYRGIVPEYFKVIPSVGIVFMTYEFIKRIFQPDAWE